MNIHNRILELCSKYKSEAFEVSTTKEKAFKVPTQMKILRELVQTSEQELSYLIQPRFIDIGQAQRTVGVTVKIVDVARKATLAEGFGISTRYTYTIESKVKDAATEVAQTIALGKALSVLGIYSPDGASTYTKDEMTLFEQTRDKVDPINLRSKAAQLISELDEDLKKRMKIAGLTIDTILDLVDVTKSNSKQLTERVILFLETPKGTTKSDVR